MSSKMKKFIFPRVTLGVVLLLVACGDDVTIINENVGVQTFESLDKLPECTIENQGEMAIVQNDGLVYYCETFEWKTLNGQNGEKGEKGNTGDKGNIGDKGKDGKSCTVEKLAENSGYKVICGGDSVGIILNGERGEKGDTGDKGNIGDKGKDGKSCTVEKLAENSGYKVICGGDSVGIILNGERGEKGDTGDKGNIGDNGKDGKSCTVEKLAENSGYKVICGGDSVGIVLNGEKGEKGDTGDKGNIGDNGKDGKSCTIEKLTEYSGYKVICGGDSVGIVLDGKKGDDGKSCRAEKNDEENGFDLYCDEVFIGTITNGTQGIQGNQGEKGESCSATDKGNGVVEIKYGNNDPIQVFKAMCGSQSYDPKDRLCLENTLYNLCNGNTYNPNDETCDNGIISGYFIDNRGEQNQTYKYVKIGSQTWMAENLNYRVFYEREGASAKDSGSYCYGHFANNCATYGRLYTWAAAMDSVNQGNCGYASSSCEPQTPHQGICPNEWHLPTKDEWDTLKTFIKSKNDISDDKVALHLKAKNGWPYSSNLDTYGFSALPVGYRYGYGGFSDNNEVRFWTASFKDNSDSFNGAIYISYYYSLIPNNNYLKEDDQDNNNYAYSVRCIKNK